MHTGVFWGYVGLIEGIVTRIKAEFGAHEGGLDRRPRPGVRRLDSVIDQVAPDITARGLIEIWKRSKQAA